MPASASDRRPSEPSLGGPTHANAFPSAQAAKPTKNKKKKNKKKNGANQQATKDDTQTPPPEPKAESFTEEAVSDSSDISEMPKEINEDKITIISKNDPTSVDHKAIHAAVLAVIKASKVDIYTLLERLGKTADITLEKKEFKNIDNSSPTIDPEAIKAAIASVISASKLDAYKILGTCSGSEATDPKVHSKGTLVVDPEAINAAVLAVIEASKININTILKSLSPGPIKQTTRPTKADPPKIDQEAIQAAVLAVIKASKLNVESVLKSVHPESAKETAPGKETVPVKDVAAAKASSTSVPQMPPNAVQAAVESAIKTSDLKIYSILNNVHGDLDRHVSPAQNPSHNPTWADILEKGTKNEPSHVNPSTKNTEADMTETYQQSSTEHILSPPNKVPTSFETHPIKPATNDSSNSLAGHSTSTKSTTVPQAHSTILDMNVDESAHKDENTFEAKSEASMRTDKALPPLHIERLSSDIPQAGPAPFLATSIQSGQGRQNVQGSQALGASRSYEPFPQQQQQQQQQQSYQSNPHSQNDLGHRTSSSDNSIKRPPQAIPVPPTASQIPPTVNHPSGQESAPNRARPSAPPPHPHRTEPLPKEKKTTCNIL